MNETLQVIQRRASLRRYAQRDIPEDVLDTVIRHAMRAPTAGNMMMYSILVIRDQRIKDVLARTCDNQPFIAKAPVLLLFLADVERWDRYFKLCDAESFEDDRGGAYSYPTPADLMLALSDALIAAQNAVVAAESLGLGSCYIGDIMEQYETHRDLLDLPEKSFPIALLTLGYPEDGYTAVQRDRFDPKFIVSHDRYQRLEDDAILEMFAPQVHAYRADNPYGAANWGQMFYARKVGSAFMQEMNRSIKEMLKHWNF